jgi:hypothetical protein
MLFEEVSLQVNRGDRIKFVSQQLPLRSTAAFAALQAMSPDPLAPFSA